MNGIVVGAWWAQYPTGQRDETTVVDSLRIEHIGESTLTYSRWRLTPDGVLSLADEGVDVALADWLAIAEAGDLVLIATPAE